MRALKFIFILITIFSIADVYAQTASLQNALLWRIEKSGIRPSYLFGTLHSICKEDFEMPTPVKTALQQSNAVYFETVFLNEKKSTAHKRIIADTPLVKKIGLKYFEKLKKIINTGLDLPDRVLDNMSPAMAYMMLENFGGNCRTTSYEYEITKLIDSSGKAIMGLETAEEHAAVPKKINHIKAVNIVEALRSKINNYDRDQQEKDRLRNLYLERNLTAIHNLTLKFQSAKSRKAYLDDRNLNWLPVIENAMMKQSSFFAVGAGHLPGENGIINLLKSKGYSITPIY